MSGREMDEEGLEFGGLTYAEERAGRQAGAAEARRSTNSGLVVDCGAAGLGLGPRRTKAERANPRILDLGRRGRETERRGL
jgi:hypothetical protein